MAAEPTGPPTPEAGPPTPGDVEQAAARLAGIVRRTPVERSSTLDLIASAQAFLKCENLQRTGSFKFRGAYHAVSRYAASRPEGSQGLFAYSSGNHAQAVALAARLLGVAATILMPEDAPRVKLAATRGYGAEVITYDRFRRRREDIAAELAPARGLTLLPGFDHADVIAGQGTAARELLLEIPDLDLLLVPLGGGGLLAGCALAAAGLRPGCRVIGVEPELAADGARSFATGELHTVHNPPTIADGARTPSLGELTFPLIRRYVADVATVSEAAIVRTMRFLWERTKLVVEPTGALAAAALLEAVVVAPGKRVGIILSGGNVDVSQAAELFSDGGAR